MRAAEKAFIVAGELILVVDDGQENREFIIDYVLKPHDFRFAIARDGREAFDAIQRQRPDLVLLDYQMPVMNGVELLHALHSKNISVPVILMTFYGSEEVAIDVYRLGVRDYIKKPFSIDEMLMAINRCLEDARLRREKEALTERLIAANMELKTRWKDLNTLYTVGKSVSALMETEQLLPRMVDAAVYATEAEEGFLYLAGKDGGFTCAAAKQTAQPRAEYLDTPVTDRTLLGIAQEAYGKTEPTLYTPDKPTRGLTSIACAPIMLGGKPVGVLGVRNVSPGAGTFDRNAATMLSALTDYAAIALQNARFMEAERETKEREKDQIRSTFQRFVPHQVVDEVLKNPGALRLGGRRQEITILFVDIRGYTAYSENLSPELVVEMLNDYLSLAANVIMGYGGTLDKYMGDGLMALFNAPDPQPDHLAQAVEAALMLQQAARELSAQRRDSISFSVGIHCGEAVVGYIGTDSAMNYTAVGDAVNVAKRLQEAARPGQVLIEETVVARLDGQVQANSLGELKIRGRQRPAIVYELVR